MIQGMSPELRPGRWAFVASDAPTLMAVALGGFREAEGLSLIVPAEAVDAAAVLAVLAANVGMARGLAAGLPARLRGDGAHPCPCGCDRALDHAVMTAPDRRDPDLVARLRAVAGRVL